MPGKSDARRPTAEFDDFADALTAFIRATRRVRGEAGTAGSRPLSLSQFAVLQAVYEEGDATVGELARAAGVSMPTVTRMLRGLERDGIVERNRADEDRRVVRVHLTDAGKRLMDEKQTWITERQHELFAGLSPADQRSIGPLMRRLAALVEQL